jgi:O-antigen ligase
MNRIGLGFLFVLCALLSFFLASGNWFALAALFIVIVGINIWLAGYRVVLILWLIGSPTLFVFANNVLQVLPTVTVERLLLVMLIAMLLLKRIFSPPLPADADQDPNFFWRLLSLEKMFFLFAGWLIFTWVLRDMRGDYPVEIKDDFVTLMQYFTPMLAFTLMRFLPWSRQQLTQLYWGLIAVGLFLAITAVLQRKLGITWFVPVYMEVIASATRATGTFSNPSEFGLVQSALLIIGLFIGSRAKDTMARTFIFTCCLVIFGSVILSGSRAPLVGLAVSLVYLFAVDRTIRPLLTFLAAIGGLVGMMVLPLVIDLPTLMERLKELSPIYNRLALWVAAVSMALSNPLVGIGFGRGAFKEALMDYSISWGPISAQWASGVSIPHNEFLHVAAWSGILGLSLYLYIIIHGWRLIQKIQSDVSLEPWVRDHAIYIGALWINYFVTGLWVDLGWFNYIAVLTYMLLGAMYSHAASASNPIASNKIS